MAGPQTAGATAIADAVEALVAALHEPALWTRIVEHGTRAYVHEKEVARLRVFTLAEVHEMTRISLRTLATSCRAGTVEHVHHGNLRGLTAEQVLKLLATHTVPPRAEVGGPRTSETDELEEAREASRRVWARGRRR